MQQRRTKNSLPGHSWIAAVCGFMLVGRNILAAMILCESSRVFVSVLQGAWMCKLSTGLDEAPEAVSPTVGSRQHV